MAEHTATTEQSFKDYYEILHLHAEADAAMVDQAYWHLARLYNAAIPSDSQAREKLDDLNEAYSVLRSHELRVAYDQARNELVAAGALPVASEEPLAEAPPLAVMAKQRPKPKPRKNGGRKKAQAKTEGQVQLGVRQFSIPPWQNVVGALVIVVLAGAALVSGAQPVLIVALLIVGLAFTLVPVVRNLPRLPELSSPAFQLPTIRAPRLPERHQAQASVDPDTLRRSTEAMRQRWRVETEGMPTAFPEHMPWPDSLAKDPPDKSPDATS